MKPSLQLKLGQHLTMTPQLQQAIRLLQLSTLELQTEIQQALEENPMLESEEDSAEAAANSETDNDANTNETAEVTSETTLEMDKNQEMPDELAVDSNWEDTYDITTATAPSSQASNDSGNDYLENQSIDGDTLSEHLIWQLQNSPFSDNDLIIAIAVIDAINDDGYLTESVEDIF
jgi:RNA polymerase sigma-54 factor